jgi:hypothetical protein
VIGSTDRHLTPDHDVVVGVALAADHGSAQGNGFGVVDGEIIAWLEGREQRRPIEWPHRRREGDPDTVALSA